MKNFANTILACVVLAGCASSAGIAPQSSPLQAADMAFDAQNISKSAAEASWPNEKWWQIYGDTQLDALMARALQDNPGLREVAARGRQAAALVERTDADGKPHVAAVASLDRQLFSEHDFIPAPEAGNYAWYNRLALQAGYDLDLWGKHHHALAASLAQKQLADAETQLASLTLEQAVTHAYVELSLQFALRDMAEERLAHRNQALDVVRKRLQAGLVSEVDVTQLEATLPPLALEIEQCEERITVLRNQLAVLSGQGPGAGAQIDRPHLQLQTVQTALPSTLPADLIGRRPDVVASRWGVEAASQQISVARAAFYPDIDLKAFIGFQAIGFSRFLSGESSIRGVGPAISLPIFDGGALRANLGANTAAYDAAVERYNSTLLKALESVTDRLVAVQSVVKQRELNDTALATACRARELAAKGVAAGMTDYLVLIESEINLLARQQEQVRLQARQLEEHAELMLALGGGLPPQAVPDMASPNHPAPDNIHKAKQS
ncbi:efflux transporter outer membrane subunit [uncultured Oxalicibacterium sp.]|uniref:efflux transporter outer membrane subunit n=1 Tax=uncultured Oxalicibacterium sp. TaxID=1168540 RepID=UPI0025F046F6|nr:efflux transporter outer membrane subunit [uncultured Oxalicibacterium sp.]